MYVDLARAKKNVKRDYNYSPSQKGEGGASLLVPIGQLLHKQGGLTLGYSG
jgi:hypothetical protein